MSDLEVIIINNREYYSADDLKARYPKFFVECSKSVRRVVEKKEIPKRSYMYAIKSDDGWIISSEDNRRTGKLLLRANWVEVNIPKFGSVLEAVVKDAPDIIELKDSEKFTDDDGIIIEVEVRGERKASGCYFRVSDLSDGFEIKTLKYTIMDDRKNGYQLNVHYVYFDISKSGGTKRTMFLTYAGFFRVTETSIKYHILATRMRNWLYQFGENDKDYVVDIIKAK